MIELIEFLLTLCPHGSQISSLMIKLYNFYCPSPTRAYVKLKYRMQDIIIMGQGVLSPRSLSLTSPS